MTINKAVYLLVLLGILAVGSLMFFKAGRSMNTLAQDETFITMVKMLDRQVVFNPGGK